MITRVNEIIFPYTRNSLRYTELYVNAFILLYVLPIHFLVINHVALFAGINVKQPQLYYTLIEVDQGVFTSYQNLENF